MVTRARTSILFHRIAVPDSIQIMNNGQNNNLIKQNKDKEGLKLVVETVELVAIEAVLDGRDGLIREVNDQALQH